MNAELINTGSELMWGRVLNTHQQWLCARLSELGWTVTRQVSVPDTGAAIEMATAEALARADLVVTTGGLGPTSDDLTRDRIAALLGRPLVLHESSLEWIRAFFASRNRPMPPRVAVQAQIPAGAVVLPNAHGTAPGLAVQVEAGRFRPEASWLILLPGPPRELRPMFAQQVVPLIRERIPPPPDCRRVTLRTCGIGESWVEERVSPVVAPLLELGLEIGYCARNGEVDVHLVARGAAAASVVANAEAGVRQVLRNRVFGTDDELLEEVVIRAAIRLGVRIATAESCTGGYVANRLTNIPGSSAAFWGGWITYDNAAKECELGVATETLREHGAVSAACAKEMAEGALARAGVDHALAITGIAGPDGGTPEKPVGTAFIGLASATAPTLVRHVFNPLDRETFKFVTSQQALEMLRQRLIRFTRRRPATLEIPGSPPQNGA